VSFVRTEIKGLLGRWSEAIAAVTATSFGLWLFVLGGWILRPVGLILVVLGFGWCVIAWRRLRFLRGASAPGVVEVDEGQVGYWGPNFGGFIALEDLAELRLVDVGNTRQWRLRTLGGEVLMVPVDAVGAGRLYDAFVTLPGIDMAALTAALNRGVGTPPLWKRADPSLPRR
jgi:hypothetical protein